MMIGQLATVAGKRDEKTLDKESCRLDRATRRWGLALWPH
jgi:hypothetical protein